MKFKEMAVVFEVVDTLSSRTAITHELAGLLGKASAREAQKLSYLFLGSLTPPYVSSTFALAQKTLLKIVGRMLNISDEEVMVRMGKVGDVGSLLGTHEWMPQGDLSVDDVFQALIELEAVHGTGSQEEKSEKLYALLHQLDPLSAKYIIRIILGTLRLGFSDMTIIDALSVMHVGDKSIRPVLEHAYNVCADLGLIAYQLKHGGKEAIEHMAIQVGIPICPAAAERLESAQAIIEKLGPCVVQPKLDGFRLQVHIDMTGKEPLIKFFSRNLLDMSEMFPEFVEVCKRLPVKTFIADGEAIVYDSNTGTFLPFQETVKRKRKHGIQEAMVELPLQLNLFDLLYLDGKSLLSSEHHTRRKLLLDVYENYKQQVIFALPKKSTQLSFFDAPVVSDDVVETLQVVQEISVTTPQALEAYFMQEITAGLEGVVVKKIHAHYQAGKRNFNWIKLKYQVSTKLQDTIDVVILGYYSGRGKRAQFGIGAFLVGIYNQTHTTFETVAKVGTGLKDHEWLELKKICDEHKVGSQPKNVTCAKELFPEVWVDPVVVCEVLADEITISPLHTAGKTQDGLGLAFRFPRFIRFRFDKSAFQTTTLSELKKM